LRLRIGRNLQDREREVPKGRCPLMLDVKHYGAFSQGMSELGYVEGRDFGAVTAGVREAPTV